MTLTQTLIATAVALCAVQAQALTWSIAAGGYSTQAGARHETFDDVATDANEALDMSYAGGNLFNNSIGGISDSIKRRVGIHGPAVATQHVDLQGHLRRKSAIRNPRSAIP